MSRHDIDIYVIEGRILDATFAALVVAVCVAQGIRRHLTLRFKKAR